MTRVAMLPPPNLNGNSGSAVYARLQAQTLARRGVDVHVLAGSDVALDGVCVHRTAVPIPHPTAEHDTSITAREYHETITTLVDALLHLHEHAPLDAVHAFYSTFTGYAACVVQALTGVPAVVSCFGRDVNPGMPPAPIARRLTTSCLRNARCLLAGNEATRTHLRSLLGDPAAPVTVVPMGVDDTAFRPGRFSQAEARAALGWRVDGRVVMTVASHMLPEKQVELVVEAGAEILGEDPAARLVVVGPARDGGTGAVDRMRACIARTGRDEAAVFAGEQPHERIPLYLAAADVVVDARRADNFSSSLLEAIAMGRAVVISHTARRQLGPYDAPFPSFRDGDRAGLRNVLRRLLADAGERVGVADAAHSWWATHRARLSLDATTLALLDIYDAVPVGRCMVSTA